ncbi:MAG: putative peroxiredoxin, partial [Pseudonocardia sp.]|nr:putative peroxiredoxin [Pseudonocardia sp.]
MPSKAVISLTTGLEDAEKVTVAYLVAVGAAESGRPESRVAYTYAELLCVGLRNGGVRARC